MVTLKEEGYKTIGKQLTGQYWLYTCITDAENPLVSTDPLSNTGGLVGISEAVELEQLTHDSVDNAEFGNNKSHLTLKYNLYKQVKEKQKR